MKLFFIFVAILALNFSCFAEDLITVGCQAMGATKLDAEIAAVQYGFIVSKDAEQLMLRSEEITDKDGKKYWVAELIVKVKPSELKFLEGPAKEKRVD